MAKKGKPIFIGALGMIPKDSEERQEDPKRNYQDISDYSIKIGQKKSPRDRQRLVNQTPWTHHQLTLYEKYSNNFEIQTDQPIPTRRPDPVFY